MISFPFAQSDQNVDGQGLHRSEEFPLAQHQILNPCVMSITPFYAFGKAQGSLRTGTPSQTRSHSWRTFLQNSFRLPIIPLPSI